MVQDPIEYIRRNYPDCITQSCRENNCSLQLKGVSLGSLAIIHGTGYQKNNNITEKLCDRIVFCRDHGLILAAVELKSGNNIHMSEAIEQIQNGLKVAKDILRDLPIAKWLPLLLYTGHMHAAETRLLRTKTVEFRGERKNVIKRNCNTQLSTVLSN